MGSEPVMDEPAVTALSMAEFSAFTPERLC